MKYYQFKCSVFIVLFSLLFSSCFQQNTQIQSTIQKLEEIEQSPTSHYNALSKYSAEVNPLNKELDAIQFPKKAHQFTIQIISPAYLSRKEINSLVNTLQPPANSSEQTRAELDFLLELQNSRSSKQVEEALRMHDIVYFPIIGMKNEAHLFFEVYEILGEEFQAKSYPNTKQLLNNVMKEMRITEFTAKNHFLRARPRQLESGLQPLKRMKTASFASGHTLWAYVQAYLLGALIPEKRDEFLKLAFEIGFSREILGVHYPSDEEASRKLAHQLLTQMWTKPKFIHDFNKAQIEWGD